MKVKFELDIGANEVLRLANAKPADTRFPTPRAFRVAMADFDSDADPLGAIFADIGKPKSREELRVFAKKHGLPDPDEISEIMKRVLNGGAPPRKPTQDGDKAQPRTYEARLDDGDLGALLYALEKTVPELKALGDAAQPDLIARMNMLRERLKQAKAVPA